MRTDWHPPLKFVAAFILSLALSEPGEAAAILRKGINLSFIFQYPERVAASARAYSAYPYVNQKTMLSAEIFVLKEIGFDFVRIPIDPGPLLEAESSKRAQLIQQIMKQVQRFSDAGLSVILDPHPESGAGYWSDREILFGPSEKLFQYQTVLLQLAMAVEQSGDERVLLELFNEPPGACSSPLAVRWLNSQKRLIDLIRSQAKTVKIISIGPCAGWIDGLEKFVPSRPSDPNIYYSTHFYEPFYFTHQGAPQQTSGLRYVKHLPFPHTDVSRSDHADMIEDTVGAQPNALALRQDAERRVADYLRDRHDKQTIKARLQRVVAWAERFGIPRNRLLIGEFGAVRSSAGGGGAKREDRDNWFAAVRGAAEELEIGWCVWAYRGRWFGIIEEDTGKSEGSTREAFGLNP